MRLLADDGTSLELSVVGYESPRLAGDLDSNWLIIAGCAALDGREWKFRDPCLLTNEVSALADWFEARSKAPSDDGEIWFIEPNLYFKWSQGVLQVNLDFESRPSWAPEDNTEEFYLRFSPSPDELASAASSLRADLVKYPIRPEGGLAKALLKLCQRLIHK
jgi:hypothetical protein